MSSAAGQLAMLAHGKRVRILYKTILKLHRGLPPDLAYMGDAYVKDEFRRHKKANPEQTIAFMEAWAVSFISFFVGKLCALQQKCVFRNTPSLYLGKLVLKGHSLPRGPSVHKCLSMN